MQDDHRETLARLMQEYGDAIFRMCCMHLRDVQLAEDAAQETFLKAYRHLGSFRRDCSEKTWLTGIAINVCRDFLRTAWLRRVDRSVDISLLPECAQADEFHDSTVLTQVMQLPPKLREVILLRYYQEMSIKETADALHIGLSTVKQLAAYLATDPRERGEWLESYLTATTALPMETPAAVVLNDTQPKTGELPLAQAQVYADAALADMFGMTEAEVAGLDHDVDARLIENEDRRIWSLTYGDSEGMYYVYLDAATGEIPDVSMSTGGNG